jgi:endogenous inhibitor of DNA gyrase (YacG/DUF329 family)
MPKCPICGRDTAPKRAFCSDRCRQIDLGKWLNEDYRVPIDDSESEPDPSIRPSTPQPFTRN